MKPITAAEFSAEVLDAREPVVVDFYTADCPPCRALAPILEDWELESEGALKVVKVDAASETQLSASYGVTAVPALYLFSNGKCVAQTIGLKSKSNLKKWFDEAKPA
jgi:thioredoxin 1